LSLFGIGLRQIMHLRAIGDHVVDLITMLGLSAAVQLAVRKEVDGRNGVDGRKMASPASNGESFMPRR
jgi:hypothetical protein